MKAVYLFLGLLALVASEVEVQEIETLGLSNGNCDTIAHLAISKKGSRYQWGGKGPNTFDCSGLAYWCHRQIGINIPGSSGPQSTGGRPATGGLKPGDLLFYNTSGQGVSHVGIYIGGGQMVHAPKPGDVVKQVSMQSSYWTSRFVRARRYC